MTLRLVIPQSVFHLPLTALCLAAVMLGTAVHAQDGNAPALPGKLNDSMKIKSESMTGRPDREVILEKNVEIIRDKTEIEADYVRYDIVEDQVNAAGDVRINRAGDRFSGSALRLKMDTGEGYMQSPVYQLLRKNAHGSAARINFESEESATAIKGIYTTCEGPDPDWYLRTGTLTLDNDRGIGSASNAVLFFKGVPIAGTPYVSFPLTETRTSGFLAPVIGTSTTGGLEITTPYYWDIAPNRDLILYPHYISRRGLMLGGDARYLGEDYSGNVRAEVLNNDTINGNNRYSAYLLHKQILAPDLRLLTDLSMASDNDYAKDFPFTQVWGGRPAFSRRLLPRDVQLQYDSAEWNGMLRMIDYQILQDPNAIIRVPYGRLPQVSFNQFAYSDNGFSWNLNSEFSRFTNPTLTLAQGDRLMVNPRLSYSYNRPGYFLRPSLSVHGTMYSLDRLPNAEMTAPSRVLPTVSLDSGLIFERDVHFFGQTAIQSLEPRLFYTYTPYQQQDATLYPNFDSAESDFNYAQVFRENRFVGNDRIGDANKLTSALITRFLQPNGVERLRLAVAQRFSFENQRVVLGVPDIGPSGTVNTRSDLLFLSTGHITEQLRVDVNLQYSQTLKEFNRVNFGTYWQPEPMKVLNVQYRRDIRDTTATSTTNFELFDISGQWPLSARWYGVGRINYLIKEKTLGQSLAGFEYKADCWNFRFIGQRVPTAEGLANTTFFIQFDFNGLSSLGSNPMRALRLNVPGYQSLNQQPATELDNTAY